ncbi:MAG TPA: hypothetical protein VHY22_04260 [Chthoniobacteraceae bacterium]|jgi:hypothetical protein|nr:hypothetical protein [Chthoniobacteraceae bacterium]
MMTLFRKVFWLALFAAFTLGFVTLFDHGYVTNHQFIADAKSEINDLMVLFAKAKTPDKKPAQP